jgi:hypothetical protein
VVRAGVDVDERRRPFWAAERTNPIRLPLPFPVPELPLGTKDDGPMVRDSPCDGEQA